MPTYFPYKIIYDFLKPHPFKVQIYFYRAYFLNNMKSSNCRGRSIRNNNNGLSTGQVLQSLSQLINSVVENNSYSMCYSAKSKKGHIVYVNLHNIRGERLEIHCSFKGTHNRRFYMHPNDSFKHSIYIKSWLKAFP